MDEEKPTDEEIDEMRRNEPKKESKWKYLMWAVLIIFLAILIYGVILLAMPWFNSLLSG